MSEKFAFQLIGILIGALLGFPIIYYLDKGEGKPTSFKTVSKQWYKNVAVKAAGIILLICIIIEIVRQSL